MTARYLSSSSDFYQDTYFVVKLIGRSFKLIGEWTIKLIHFNDSFRFISKVGVRPKQTDNYQYFFPETDPYKPKLTIYVLKRRPCVPFGDKHVRFRYQ